MKRYLLFLAGFLLIIALISGLYLGQYRADTLSIKTPELRKPFDMTQFLGSEWEKLCFLGPYSTNTLARQITGIDVDIENRSNIDTHDGISLIIVLSHSEITNLLEVPRNQIDFANLTGNCYQPSQEFIIESETWPKALALEQH